MKDKLKKIQSFFLKHKIRNTIIVIAILLLGLFAWKNVAAQSQQPQYQTTAVEKGSIIQTVSESGNVSQSSEVSITSPSTGIITDIYVKNGDQVEEGTNLFEVKSTASAQDQASAYASYQNAVSSLTSAQQNKDNLDAAMWTQQQAVLTAQDNVNYKNDNTTNPQTDQTYTDLQKQAIDSALVQAQKNFSAAEKQYKEADVAINAAQASVNSASLAYQATQNSIVTAPVAGTVANLSVTSGNSVTASSGNSSSNNSSSSNSSSSNSSSSSSSSGSSTDSSSTVLLLTNHATLNVRAQVSEVDAPKIKAGQKAIITLDAFPDKTFVGTVSQMDSVGTVSSGVVTYNVSVTFTDPPEDIGSGMSATVNIQTNRKDNTITVPSTAVQKQNGESVVRVLKNGKVTFTPVETGLTSDTSTEITSGLSEGQTVVTGSSGGTQSGAGSSPFSRSPFGGGGGNVRVFNR